MKISPYNLPSGWKIKNGYLIGYNDNSNYSYLISSDTESNKLTSLTYRINSGSLTDKTNLAGDDDNIHTINISNSNTFSFYGVDYSSIYIHDNGVIGFTSNALTWVFLNRSDVVDNKKLIMPFFEDHATYGSEGGERPKVDKKTKNIIMDITMII